jgi:DUF4097 and DUF4098 domain-containing protein YvlB
MRRLLIALALVLLASGAYADSRSRFSEDDGDDCSGRHYRFHHGRPSFVSEETIEAGNLRSLKVASENAPISVRGGNSRGYTIVVCKAAEFEEDLDDIRVAVNGGEVKATGPSGNEWMVAYKIYAPDRADVEVESRNGPVAFRDLNGTIVAHLTNGPVALDDVEGNVDITTKNGPVSIEGGAGTIKLRASNGPLSVHLDGNSFNGTLDATTNNGPLSVRVPRGYGSGVVVEASGRGPISCRAEGCKSISRYDDDGDEYPRRIELGRGPEAVRISTVNGPVTIRED